MDKILYRIVFALVFIGAGIFRLLNLDAGFHEMEMLGLPVFFTYIVLIFETACGILLLIGKKIHLVYISLGIFLTCALLWGFISNFKIIVNTSSELFIFNATATDMMLHFMYLVLILAILRKQK